MEEYINIGKINKIKFDKISNKIYTDEVILTHERFMHIQENHSKDFELYFSKAADIVENPDYILEDSKNKDTILVIKGIEETNINLIIRLAVENDEKHTKNSIMTFYRLRDKNLKKLVEKHETIYKKE